MAPKKQHIDDLSARMEEARQRWLDLATIARTHYAKGAPADETAAALAAVDRAERVYRDLRAQWIETRLANNAT